MAEDARLDDGRGLICGLLGMALGVTFGADSEEERGGRDDDDGALLADDKGAAILLLSAIPSGDDNEYLCLSGECSAVMLAVNSDESSVLLAGVAYDGIPLTLSRSDSE